ncbi:MAG: DUF4229 domain-containing protein [Nocardioides sp.]|nr:DUF4229 domain-containing protein [Nocardioides sp.]
MKPFVIYTLLRVALFVACYSLTIGVYMLVAGTDSVPVLWPLLVAVVLSSLLSYPLLRGPRVRFAQRIEERAQRATERFEASKAKEDVD